ncbi:Retrotransposon gag protein [Cucumis melo var. makuwa]|uniref:Retrotransposon gag protein n=1 Tax=Cucumis melo var. makuwa TaxID=1194695 RepID=A0A5A7U2V1_CUCMM|nr:Retrotransposon gag protein [Cucumis melo var. makuwa]
MVAEIKITKPVLCLARSKAPPNQAAMLNKPGMKRTVGKFGNRPRDFTYDVSKADEIYDCLEKVGLVGSPEHQVQLDTLKGQNPVCKFHASNSHATADSVAFRHAIQDKRRLAEVSRKGKRDLD